MKKIYTCIIKHVFIASSLLYLISGTLKAQDSIQWGLIYDYNIGDIFQFEETGYGHHTYYSWTITGKSFLTDNNSVTYEIYKVEEDRGPECPEGCLRIDTITKEYGYLDSYLAGTYIVDPEKYHSRPYCTKYQDINHMTFGHIFAVGLGETYYYYDENDPSPIFMNRKLVYYKKGDEEWGTALTVGIEETPENMAGFRIYPNPADHEINFKGKHQYNRIEILSLNGKLIKSIDASAKKQKIDLSGIKTGMYILKAISTDKTEVKKLIIR